jgi:hypothetical protein
LWRSFSGQLRQKFSNLFLNFPKSARFYSLGIIARGGADAGVALGAAHSRGGGSSVGCVAQPARNKLMKPKMTTGNLDTRQFCGTQVRTQDDFG